MVHNLQPTILTNSIVATRESRYPIFGSGPPPSRQSRPGFNLPSALAAVSRRHRRQKRLGNGMPTSSELPLNWCSCGDRPPSQLLRHERLLPLTGFSRSTPLSCLRLPRSLRGYSSIPRPLSPSPFFPLPRPFPLRRHLPSLRSRSSPATAVRCFLLSLPLPQWSPPSQLRSQKLRG